MGKSPWRLIPPLDATGQFHMSLDWWLLQQHRLGKFPPCLRFYTWQEATISLGYHQKTWAVAWENITWQGKLLSLVQRPTGGRAVLHQGDLTYMVVTSDQHGTRQQVYQKICEFLRRGWRSLGVNLDYGEAKRGYIHNLGCFTTATGADLVDLNGHKLIGSAQLKQGKAILQHGSIMLSPDPELYHQVFGEPLPHGMDLSHLTIETIIKALTEAAIACFDVDLITQPISESEKQEVIALTLKQPELKFLNEPIFSNSSTN